MGAVEAAALNEAVAASNSWSAPVNPYETTTYYAAMAPPATPLSDYYYTAATFAATTAPPPPTSATLPLPEPSTAAQLVAPVAATVPPAMTTATTNTTTAGTKVTTIATTQAATTLVPPLIATSTNLCQQGITYHYATALTTATCAADGYDLNQYFNQYQIAPLIASSSCDNNPLIVHCNSASTAVTNSISATTNSDASSPYDSSKCKKKAIRSRGTSLLAQPSPKSATSRQITKLDYISKLCVQIEHSYAAGAMPPTPAITVGVAQKVVSRSPALLVYK